MVLGRPEIFICSEIGSNIDWKEDIMGSRFDFQNPNASSTCGCRTTFSMENEEF